MSSGSYDRASFKGLTFHDAVPRFLAGQDTPRAYLERCLEAIAAKDGVVQAFVVLNEDSARAAADDCDGLGAADRRGGQRDIRSADDGDLLLIWGTGFGHFTV